MNSSRILPLKYMWVYTHISFKLRTETVSGEGDSEKWRLTFDLFKV